VIVSNLKPAKIRGFESKGMLLAAEDDRGTCSLLDPQDATPGTEIYIEGIPREPSSILEFEDFKKVMMIVGENQKAMYNGKSLQTKKDVVVTDKNVKKGTKIL
jgi:methionyl-tRNA synthetase